MPIFTPDPAWCEVAYIYTIADPAGGVTVTFDPDPAVREFTFHYEADILLTGPSSIGYTVTVTGTTGNVVE